MTQSPGERTGLLLVGHGTRSAVGVEQFLTLARRIADRLRPLPVEPAFLELQSPDLDSAVSRLVEHGIDRLATLPLLLFAAGHAKEDIPHLVKAALERRGKGHIKHRQAAHLGCHPALVELSERRMNEATPVGWAVPTPLDQTGGRSPPYLLLLVGRGSHDESATAEMHEFVHLRSEKLPGAKVEVAFLAMARPLLSEQLQVIAQQGHRQVIVQPHLLFDGELVASIAAQVTATAAAWPKTQWLIVPPLADPPDKMTIAVKLLEKVILDRCNEAGIHVVGPKAGD